MANHNIAEPLTFIDADGEEVKYCIYCDTETGRVEFYDIDNVDFLHAPVVTEYRPLPIRVLITQKEIT